MAQPNRYQAPEHAENETSVLFEAVQCTQPLYTSNTEASQAMANQLEQLAAKHGMSIAALIEQAHTTQDSFPHHIEALHLERQLAFLHR